VFINLFLQESAKYVLSPQCFNANQFSFFPYYNSTTQVDFIPITKNDKKLNTGLQINTTEMKYLKLEMNDRPSK